MRLTKKQLIAIKKVFSKNFFYNDTLWLFGSRTDDSKKWPNNLCYQPTQIPSTDTV